jgi:hypothetical protein
MTFEEILEQAMAMLQRRGRLTYRTLKLQFHLDDEHLEVLKDELIYGQRLAVDEDGRVLVWTGDTGTAPPAAAARAETPARTPLAYPPPISPRRFSRPAVPSKASGSRSRCSSLISKARRS